MLGDEDLVGGGHSAAETRLPGLFSLWSPPSSQHYGNCIFLRLLVLFLFSYYILNRRFQLPENLPSEWR